MTTGVVALVATVRARRVAVVVAGGYACWAPIFSAFVEPHFDTVTDEINPESSECAGNVDAGRNWRR